MLHPRDGQHQEMPRGCPGGGGGGGGGELTDALISKTCMTRLGSAVRTFLRLDL